MGGLLVRGGTSDEVWEEDGKVSQQLSVANVQYERVLELLGASTLLDSLCCVGRGGVVCMTGILGGIWVLDGFHPMGDVPTGVKLTCYSGEAADLSQDKLNEYLSMVESGRLQVVTGQVFEFTALVKAHQLMDDNQASGKIVARGVDHDGLRPRGWLPLLRSTHLGGVTVGVTGCGSKMTYVAVSGNWVENTDERPANSSAQ